MCVSQGKANQVQAAEGYSIECVGTARVAMLPESCIFFGQRIKPRGNRAGAERLSMVVDLEMKQGGRRWLSESRNRVETEKKGRGILGIKQP
jgi:hypothetical protein